MPAGQFGRAVFQSGVADDLGNLVKQYIANKRREEELVSLAQLASRAKQGIAGAGRGTASQLMAPSQQVQTPNVSPRQIGAQLQRGGQTGQAQLTPQQVNAPNINKGIGDAVTSHFVAQPQQKLGQQVTTETYDPTKAKQQEAQALYDYIINTASLQNVAPEKQAIAQGLQALMAGYAPQQQEYQQFGQYVYKRNPNTGEIYDPQYVGTHQDRYEGSAIYRTMGDGKTHLFRTLKGTNQLEDLGEVDPRSTGLDRFVGADNQMYVFDKKNPQAGATPVTKSNVRQPVIPTFTIRQDKTKTINERIAALQAMNFDSLPQERKILGKDIPQADQARLKMKAKPDQWYAIVAHKNDKTGYLLPSEFNAGVQRQIDEEKASAAKEGIEVKEEKKSPTKKIDLTGVYQ